MANDSDERPGGTEVANLVLALVVHAFVGLPWLVFVTAFSSFFLDAGAVVWGLSGFTLWAIGLVDAVRRLQDLGAVWGALLRSWLWILGGPIALAMVGIRRLRPKPEATSQPLPALDPLEEPVNPAVERRLDEVERRLRELGQEITGLTRDVRALRVAGFALFGLALAKLFLYDLGTSAR